MRKKSVGEPSDADAVAGNGILDRRLFLKGSALASAFLVPGVSLGKPVGLGQQPHVLALGEDTQDYGLPSRLELVRNRRLVPAPSRNRSVRIGGLTPRHLLRGTVTPNGLHFEINHHGIPDISPENHELVIHGMVDQPLVFTLATLENYGCVSRQYFIECSGNSSVLWEPTPVDAHLGLTHGMLSASEWTGVPLATLLAECGVSPKASWVIAEGADSGAFNRSVPLGKAMEDSLIALYQNGERLRPGQGYPMRLLNPGFEGSTSVKWVRSLFVTDRPAMTRYETSRYTDPMPDGHALQFTLTMGVKSMIVRPSNVWALPGPGEYVISGLAWSGHGKIARVEVSADGGSSWGEAMLEEPVQPRMLTGFKIPWRWSGAPAILQSRAIDEEGNVQPTRAQLVDAQGTRSGYHYNAIHSWAVRLDGRVVHVYA